MKKKLLTLICAIMLVAVAMTAVVAVASASVTSIDYIYMGEYAHGIAGYSNDSVILFGQANEVENEEYGIAVDVDGTLKYFKAENVGTTGKFGIAFPAQTIVDGEYVAKAYLKSANGDYTYGEEIALVLNASGDYTVDVAIKDGVATWTLPAGAYNTVVKLNGEVQEVTGNSLAIAQSEDRVVGENTVTVECLTKGGYTYTGSAAMNVVEINLNNVTDLGDYGASDYLVLTDDLTIPAEYFALQTFTNDEWAQYTNDAKDMNAYALNAYLNATFDGNGHTITYDVTLGAEQTNKFMGLVANVRKTAVIKNLKVNAKVDTSAPGKSSNAVSGYTFGTVKDCVFNVDATVSDSTVFGINYYLPTYWFNSDKPETPLASYSWGTFERLVAVTNTKAAFGDNTTGYTGNGSFAKYTDLIFISPNATYPSLNDGVKNDVYMFNTAEDFFAGNGWAFDNGVLGGFFRYATNGNYYGAGAGNTATFAVTGVNWTDSVWTTGAWRIDVVESELGVMKSLKWNGQAAVQSYNMASGNEPTLAGANGGIEFSWKNLGTEYDVYTVDGNGAETKVATTTETNYVLNKSLIEGKSGKYGIKVVVKDNGSEIGYVEKNISLIANATDFKAITTGDYVQTAAFNLTSGDYRGFDYTDSYTGVYSATKSVVKSLSGNYFGQGYKITSTQVNEASNKTGHLHFGGLFCEIAKDSVVDGLNFELKASLSQYFTNGNAYNGPSGVVAFAHHGMIQNSYIDGEITKTHNYGIISKTEGHLVGIVGYTMIKDKGDASSCGDFEGCIAKLEVKQPNGVGAAYGYVAYQDYWPTTISADAAKATEITNCILVKTFTRYERFSMAQHERIGCYATQTLDSLIGEGGKVAQLSNNDFMTYNYSQASWTDSGILSYSASELRAQDAWNGAGAFKIDTTGITLYGTTVYTPAN